MDVFDSAGSRIISKAFMIQWDTVTHYRVPSQVFETSQTLEREPVQIQMGDYILREDIPDEATFRLVCEVLEGQGIREWRDNGGLRGGTARQALLVDADNELVWGKRDNTSLRRRFTPADLGITTDTQETDLSETLTAAQALREVAQGYEDGDSNPWTRTQKRVSERWHTIISPEEFKSCVDGGRELRRKPRTVRIEGEISEGAVKMLETLGGPYAEEILSAVQEQ